MKTAKDFLSQAYRIDQRINSKLEQVQSLRELAAKASATLTDIPWSGTRNVHSMESIITKMVDLEAEINNDINRLVDHKRKMVTVIKKIENPEYQTLLELRYLCFKTWEQIAVNMHYTIQNAFKIHGKALACVDALIRVEES